MGSLSASERSPLEVSPKKAMISEHTVKHKSPKRQTSGSSNDGPSRKKVCVANEVAQKVEHEAKSMNSKGGFLTYTDQDVLSGRGGGTNLHNGNRIYRDLILSHRETYDVASKAKKPGVSRKIVQMIRDRGGRFLRKGDDGLYYDIGDDSAREKTSQALRHRTFEMRNKDDPKKKKEDATQDEKQQPADIKHLSPAEACPASPSSIPDNTNLPSADPDSGVDRINDKSSHTSLPPRESLHQAGELSEEEMFRQEQIYKEAVARQQELEDVRRDPAYFEAMFALRQRDAMIDMAMAQEAQMRRYLALRSGFHSAHHPLLTGSNRLLHPSMLSAPPAIAGVPHFGSLALNRHDPALRHLPSDAAMLSSSVDCLPNRSNLFRSFGRLPQSEIMVQFPPLGTGLRSTSLSSDSQNRTWNSGRNSL